MDPEVRTWTETARELGKLIERPFQYALCLLAPLWAALGAASEVTAGAVFFWAMGVVSVVLGLAGLAGMLERPKPPPSPYQAGQPILDELSRLRDLAAADVDKWRKLRLELEEKRRAPALVGERSNQEVT